MKNPTQPATAAALSPAQGRHLRANHRGLSRRLRCALLCSALVFVAGCDDGTTQDPGDLTATSDTASDATSTAPDATGTAPDATMTSGDATEDSDATTSDATGSDTTDSDAIAGCSAGATASAETALTAVGAITGVAGNGAVSFLGIPFAAPPTGERRWAPPEPTGCLEPFVADAYGSECPQPGTGGVIGNEDCLSLNVWTPAVDAGSRPVLVFIHGGAQIQGSASVEIAAGAPIYDGERLAARGDAVVVTLQYRLGALGWMALDELATSDDVVGNFGLMDQVAALEWVRDNIAAFGGNPDDVMIFGESAGAFNVCALLGTPSAAGLFDAALMQSGNCSAAPRAGGIATGQEALALTSCAAAPDVATCLRDLDASTIVSTIPGGLFGTGGAGLSWGPTVDGTLLPQAPLEAIAAGTHNDVPFVIGSNSEEMRSEALFPFNVSTEMQYEQTVGLLLSSLGAASRTADVLAAYPVADYDTPQDALVQVATDATFTCPARIIARTAAATQTSPVHRYYFTRRAEAPTQLYASHGIELLYVFGTIDDVPFFTPAQGDAVLRDAIMDAWLALATSDDPGAGDLYDWPSYTVAEEAYVELGDAPLSAGTGLLNGKCDLWDEIAGL